MTRIHLSPPDVGEAERRALLDAFDGGWIAPVGPELDTFENEIARRVGREGAVALSSGTAALHLALLAAGVGPGDRVFVSTFTFAATANAVTYCGAEPVFIDSDPRSWNMNPELLDEALRDAARVGSLPAAVVVVDLYGQCADYDRIGPICDRFDVPLVEDAAEALGATHRGRPAGSFGASSVLSFNGNKIITTSGGGMLLTDSVAEAERARHLATQARLPCAHYEHAEVGFNYRMSNLLAAIGTAQLQRLDDIVRRRRAVHCAYRSLLADEKVSFMPVPDWSEWNAWLTCVLFEDRDRRDRVMRALDSADVEARPLWKPMHLQPVFADAEAVVDGTTDDLFARGLCLPSGGRLSTGDLERIAAIVNSA